jgi:hypothetical protein
MNDVAHLFANFLVSALIGRDVVTCQRSPSSTWSFGRRDPLQDINIASLAQDCTSHEQDSNQQRRTSRLPHYALPQPVSSAVSVTFAFAEHFSRSVAYTITQPNSLSACTIGAALSFAIARTRFAVSVTPAQWPTKLHTRQQIAVARPELHTQSFAEGGLASAQKRKGKN